jgi:hypothetical protein
MKAQTIVDKWYEQFRLENKIPSDKTVSPIDLIYYLANEKKCKRIPACDVNIIISETVRRLIQFNENADSDKFAEIFGSNELWNLFSRGYHCNILKFIAVMDPSDTEKLINFLQNLIQNKINS